MPFAPPRIASCCGRKIAHGEFCPCQRRRHAVARAKHDRNRPSARLRGYDGRWEAERRAFLTMNPKCCRCPSLATVVDHIMPHKGNMNLFWNRANWQPLCQHCHNSVKQAEERRECK